jgi:hypothetical protein
MFGFPDKTAVGHDVRSFSIGIAGPNRSIELKIVAQLKIQKMASRFSTHRDAHSTQTACLAKLGCCNANR